MPIYTAQHDRSTEDFIRSLRVRFFGALGALIVTVVISTSGFVLLGRHQGSLLDQIFLGFWDTLNLVSTVGSLHQNMTPAERAWSMLIIIIGLGAVLYGFGTVQGLFHSGDVRRYYMRRTMQKKLDEVSGHIVLCGYGNVGREVAEQVRNAGRKLIVIDVDEDAATHADDHGFLVIQADCTDEETLREAGVDRASGLIATLDNDAANVYLILLAREKNPDLRIVSRSDKGETRSTLRRAGADRVIVPGETAAIQLSHLILKPRVSEFIAAAYGEGEFDFAEVAVLDHPNLAGKTLRTLDLPRKVEAIVIAIIDEEGRQTFNPSAEYEIKPTDVMILVCRMGVIERLDSLLD